MVWQASNNNWQTAIFVDPVVSVQMLEVMAVAVSVHFWLEIPCNIVTDSAFAANQLTRMGREGFPSTKAAGVLEEGLATRIAPIAIFHVHSHSEVPGFFTTGNEVADRAASTHIFTVQDACDLHSTPQIGAHTLSRTCSIPLSVAHDVAQTCPLCNSALVIGVGVNPRSPAPLQVWQKDFT